MTAGSEYLIRLRAVRDVADRPVTIRLRAALKYLLRVQALRAVSVAELTPGAPENASPNGPTVTECRETGPSSLPQRNP